MRTIRFVGSIVLILSLLNQESFSQTTFEIKGNVKDVNGVSLPGAHVFLANTTYGVITNAKGDFLLRIPKRGNYQLVVSFAGFENYAIALEVNDNISLKVTLRELTIDLGGFVVTAKKDRKWAERFQQFRQVFLGTSRNADFCKILNKEEIDFYYNEELNILEAYATEPIIVRNRALDYEIEFYLDEFQILYNEGYSVIYGYPLFKEIFPNRVSKRRDRNRLKAYNGSVEHFFESLSGNRLNEEGYTLRKAFKNELDQIVVSADTIDTIYFPDSTTNVLKWRFSDYFVIDYKEREDANYTSFRYSINVVDSLINEVDFPMQRSWIRIKEPQNALQFDRTGYVLNPLSFAQYGYWGFERLADWVPLNYKPEPIR